MVFNTPSVRAAVVVGTTSAVARPAEQGRGVNGGIHQGWRDGDRDPVLQGRGHGGDGQRDAPAGQTPGQQGPAASEAGRGRPLRPAEESGRLPDRPPSKSHVTTASRYVSGNRASSSSRTARTSPQSSAAGSRSAPGRTGVLRPSGAVHGLRLASRVVRHPVQPAGHPAPVAQRPGLADEHEERRLERVVCVRLVPEYPATDAEHHGPVPADQGRERGLVPAGQVIGHELVVRRPGSREGRPADVVDHPDGCHRRRPSRRVCLLLPRTGRMYSRFFVRPAPRSVVEWDPRTCLAAGSCSPRAGRADLGDEPGRAVVGAVPAGRELRAAADGLHVHGREQADSAAAQALPEERKLMWLPRSASRRSSSIWWSGGRASEAANLAGASGSASHGRLGPLDRLSFVP